MNKEEEALKRLKTAILNFIAAADEFHNISNNGLEDNTTIFNTLCYLLYLNDFDMNDVEICVWNWVIENVDDCYEEEDEDYWDD